MTVDSLRDELRLASNSIAYLEKLLAFEEQSGYSSMVCDLQPLPSITRLSLLRSLASLSLPHPTKTRKENPLCVDDLQRAMFKTDLLDNVFAEKGEGSCRKGMGLEEYKQTLCLEVTDLACAKSKCYSAENWAHDFL